MKKFIQTNLAIFLLIFCGSYIAAAELGVPVVNCSVTSLSDFKYTVGGGPSPEKSFVVSGTSLTANLVVTAPSNYEISPLSGSSFISMNSIAIAHSAGNVSDITLYVRLKQGLAVNNYTGNMSVTSTNAQTKFIALSGSVMNPPSITTSVASISNLFSFYVARQSVAKSFVVNGSDLSKGIVITPPYNFEISTSPTSGFTASAITLPLSGTSISATTIYVRLNPNSYMYDYSGNISVVSTGATTKYIALTGKALYQPTITTSTTSLSGFNYFTGSGPSVLQSFSISGTDLIEAVTLTAPTNYEISTSSNPFSAQSTLTLSPTNYSLNTTTVYVRLKAGLQATTYNGSLSCSCSYATTKSIALSGTVSNQPLLSIVGANVTGLNYSVGEGPSVEKSFEISGSSLNSLVFIYAPVNFEISTTSGNDFSASNSIILPQSGGNVNSTNIYCRLKAGLDPGNYSENVTVASTGAVSQIVSLAGQVNNPRAIIDLSEIAISNIDYEKGNGPSASKSFTIRAVDITDNITLTASTNYEISTNATSGFNATLTLNHSFGTVPTTTIFVRLKSGLDIANYAGSVSVNTAGTYTRSISLSGNVTIPLGINVSDTALPGMDYSYGSGPSAEKSFTLSGNGLGSLVIITAPAGFELSTTSGTLFSAASQIILQPVYGIVNETNIYVRLQQGLNNATYSGYIAVVSSGVNSKSITVDGTVSAPVVLRQENANYEPRNNGTLNLTNNWLFARNMGNYLNAPDLLGTISTVRSMAALNGSMLFCSRSAGNQLISINGKTGLRKTTNLASYVFTYTGRNKANTADSIWATSTPCNDIKVDNAGNVLISNSMLSASSRFQIWKINPTTGTGTKVIDQADFSTLYPGKSIRIEGFNVMGDVNTSATIYAVCSSVSSIREMYKWKITNGVASSTPIVVPLDGSSDSSFGNSATVYPIDESNFYIDGDKIMPFKIDLNTGFTESFKYFPDIYTDNITSTKYSSKISPSVNGVNEFSIGSEKFLIIGATNYNLITMTPSSTFRIYKYSWNNTIQDLQCLWTFPMDGFGGNINPGRSVSSAVEVNGDKATIYVYYPENGFGVYEFVCKSDGVYTSEKTTNHNTAIRLIGKDIVSTQMLKRIALYSPTGQLLKTDENTTSIQVPENTGVYLVKSVLTTGEIITQKIIVD